MASIDGDSVKKLAAILNDTGLSEIEYDTGTLRIRVARNAVAAQVHVPMAVPAHHAAPAAAVPAAPAANDLATHPGCLKSPMVGVVYLSPEPGAAPFMKVGDQVTEGQTVVLIEAMKTFNQVKAHRAGKVTQVLVADKTPVEYGEPLIVIE
ncbi:MAG: acetyl-CoA carboxylase biotin carboxyl carrier protein [Rhodospirillaceae bacterium]|nr:acetyl-CoA carboxylase biotin carboxyl carrier protein [Rhodospirillaceae bacterium]